MEITLILQPARSDIKIGLACAHGNKLYVSYKLKTALDHKQAKRSTGLIGLKINDCIVVSKPRRGKDFSVLRCVAANVFPLPVPHKFCFSLFYQNNFASI